jgi:hypothetical protein
MFSYGCMHLNHYHHEPLGNPFQNGVCQVWVTYTTFHLSCCSVMESSHSCILKTHATIASSSSWISTHGSNFPIFGLPYRWLKSEVRGMPQNLLAPVNKLCFFKLHPWVVFNDSLDYMPLGFVACTLFVLVDLWIVFDIVWRGTFFLFISC